MMLNESSGYRIELLRDLAPLSSGAWYRVTDPQSIDFAMRVSEDGGELACTGVIFGLDDPAPITARDMRAARLAPALRAFAEWRAAAARQGYEPGTDQRPVTARVRRPGKSRRPEGYFEDVVARYRQTVATGTRSPVKDLAAELGYAPITVRKWLQIAREKGLLEELGVAPDAHKSSQRESTNGKGNPTK